MNVLSAIKCLRLSRVIQSLVSTAGGWLDGSKDLLLSSTLLDIVVIGSFTHAPKIGGATVHTTSGCSFDERLTENMAV